VRFKPKPDWPSQFEKRQSGHTRHGVAQRGERNVIVDGAEDARSSELHPHGNKQFAPIRAQWRCGSSPKSTSEPMDKLVL